MSSDNSFLPEDYLERRAQQRTNMLSIVLFVIVMVGIVAAFFVTDRQSTELRDLRLSVNGQFEEAARRLDQLEELQTKKKRMLRKAEITASLIEPIPRSVVLAELVNNMPTPLSLVSLELETKALRKRLDRHASSLAKAKAAKKKAGKDKAADPEPAGPPPTRVSLKLRGVAPTDVEVARFMTALQQRPLFSEVNLAYTQAVSIEDQAMREFEIAIVLDTRLDLGEHRPLMVKRELKQDPFTGQIQIDPDGDLVVPAGHGDAR